jgi:hypothetical protein
LKESPKYPIAEPGEAHIRNVFTYHPVKDDQEARYVEQRGMAGSLALTFMENCPSSRELSLALTKLEEAVMWANASIARNE